MTHLQRFALLCLAVWASTSHAVSMGPIETQSALYQKFQAEIEISNLGEVDPLQLQASLASTEDFERVGVERFFYLSELRFEISPRGKQYILEITSPRTISEPYLDFVVELAWRGGRMLRSYTVLLDPPGWVNTARKAPAIVAQPKPAQPRRADSAPREGRYYGPTAANDTMWKVGHATRANERISVYQQMMAIKRLNPDAYVDDNINLLKRGQMLLLPSVSQADSLSHNEAVRQTNQESTSWQARREVPVASPAKVEVPEGRLRIVTDTGAQAAASQAEADRAAPAPTSAAALSEPEPAPLEPMTVAELPAPLQAQVRALDNAIEVRDQEIAALQQQVQAMQTELNRFAEQQEPAPAASPLQRFLTNWLPPLLWLALVVALLLWIFRRTQMTPARP
jgi:pilus assembly protein FimV